MSLVFPHTFVPWFRSVAPYIHAYRGKTFVVGMAGEADRRGQAERLRAGPGRSCMRWASSWCWCTASGPRSTSSCRAKGHAARFSPRHAHHRRGGARLRPGGRRPAALRDRGGVLARACRTRRWPTPRCAWCRATSSPRGRWASSTASTSCTAASVRKVDAAAIRRAHRHRRDGAAVAVRLFAHRRGLQPDDGRRGHQRPPSRCRPTS